MATLSQLINAKAIALAKLAVRATTAAASGQRPSVERARACASGCRTDVSHDALAAGPAARSQRRSPRIVRGPCGANHLRGVRRPRCSHLSSRPS
jgi:hypothetical protein